MANNTKHIANGIETPNVNVSGLTASKALQTDSSNNLQSSSVTTTELGFVSGVTSSIQTQLNGKQATGNYISALTGDVTATGPGSVAATVAAIMGTTVSGTTGTTNVVFSASPTLSGTTSISAGGNLQIGGSSGLLPNQSIHTENNAGAAGMSISGVGTNGARLYLGIAATSLSAPTAISSGNALANIYMGGYNGSAYGGISSPTISGVATENWTTSANGRRIDFFNIVNGSIVQRNSFRMDNDGSFVINPGNAAQLSGNITWGSDNLASIGTSSSAGRPATVNVGTTINLASLTASTLLASDSSKNIVSATAASATAFLNPFTSSLQGVAPASGGGTTNFLRADGTWAAPAGGVTGSGTSGNLTKWNGTNSITSSVWTEASNGEWGYLRTVAGTAPALKIDNGGFVSTQDNIRVAINGTNSFQVTSTGQVNINRPNGDTTSTVYGINVALSAGSASSNTVRVYDTTGIAGGYIYSSVSDSTTGHGNIGLTANVENGNVGVGLWGGAATAAGTSPRSFGVMGGVGMNSVAPTSYAGGLFRINTNSLAIFDTPPSGWTTALGADNMNTSGNVVDFRANGTQSFVINSTGQSLYQVGANGTPSISFIGETNTGIYKRGTGLLTLSVAGSDLLELQNSNSATSVAGNGLIASTGSQDIGSNTNAFRSAYLTTNLNLNTAGAGIEIKEGTNATMGIATLSSGTVVVSNTAVTANTRIFLTVNGGTLTNVGSTYISARTAGTSFTISSSNILDSSNVAWLLIEPN